VPEGECLFGVVGHEDARDLRPRQRIDDLCAHLRAQFGVERAEGLVEQKHARVRGESASERDALLLTPGDLVGIALEEFGLDTGERCGGRDRAGALAAR
jgi:hypothetical protein